MNRIDIPPGTVFGQLAVIEEARTPSGRRAMRCKCQCGTQTVVAVTDLRSGHTKSCGCLRRGVVAENAPASRCEIHLYGKNARGRVALIDEDDYELVSQYRWYVFEAKRPGRRGERGNGPYAVCHLRGGDPQIRMHVLITGMSNVDHADGNGLNNRRSNLRPATNPQNGANRRKEAGPCSSAFKGVSWHKRQQRWAAHIRVDGKLRHLGSFTHEEDAARAYDEAALEAWGEYACLNFPEAGRRSGAA